MKKLMTRLVTICKGNQIIGAKVEYSTFEDEGHALYTSKYKKYIFDYTDVRAGVLETLTSQGVIQSGKDVKIRVVIGDETQDLVVSYDMLTGAIARALNHECCMALDLIENTSGVYLRVLIGQSWTDSQDYPGTSQYARVHFGK